MINSFVAFKDLKSPGQHDNWSPSPIPFSRLFSPHTVSRCLSALLCISRVPDFKRTGQSGEFGLAEGFGMKVQGQFGCARAQVPTEHWLKKCLSVTGFGISLPLCRP